MTAKNADKSTAKPISEWRVRTPTKVNLDYGGLVIIESLSNGHTGRRLWDDVSLYCKLHNPKLECRFYQPQTKVEFLELLRELRSLGWIPLLHLEAHGSVHDDIHDEPLTVDRDLGAFESASSAYEKWGLRLANDDFLSWFELYRELGELNIACRNNLGVVMSACRGINATWMFSGDPVGRAPVRMVVGPEAKEPEGCLERGFSLFYKRLLLDRDVTLAFRELRAEVPSMRLLSAEQVFALGMNGYFKKRMTRRAIEKRINAGLAEAMRTNPRTEINSLRRHTKQRLRDIDFERHKARFLMIDLFPELEGTFRDVELLR
jgi:hypothetical protein